MNRFFAAPLLCVCLQAISPAWLSPASADEVSIPLNNEGLPASDLVFGDQGSNRILNPQEAWRIKKHSGVDLSKLDPDTSDIWEKASTEEDGALDDSLPIQSGDTVNFLGIIGSSPGRFRFNVQVQSGNEPPRTLTLVLSKELHTTLLRKELLRRLGYKIPAMKHLKKIHVLLPSAEFREKTFPAALVEGTLGTVKRWQIPAPEGSDPLVISLQDVMAMEATPLFYNVAMGPPIELIANTQQIRPAGPRTIRALGAIYGVANIPENIHQSSWFVGRNENGAVVFDVPDRANFACTLDDARWVMRNIARLTRRDFEAIVAKAYFPDFVGKLLVENLLARRNSLVEKFEIDAPKISFDPKISDGKYLSNGKLVNQDWQAIGYASNFAGTEPQSPLHDIWWYVVSQLQSNLTANLVQKINDKIPSINIGDQINAHNDELYKKALEQFVKNGTTQALRLGAWAAPTANGGVDISRDIVIGSYMGTSGDNGATNIVQLADNFGFHANAGLYIGFDGLPTSPLPVNLQGQIMGSASVAVTHLKPITSLKAAVHEPLKHEFVPWIFYKASGVFKELSELQNGSPQTPDEVKKNLADRLGELKTFIDKGESLILTESISASESAQIGVQAPISLSPSIGVQRGANQVVLWRLHIYRPQNSPNTIMVYKDNGALNGVQISLNFSVGEPASFPVLQVTAKNVSGTADTELYRMNINPDPQQNPSIYSNSAALVSALRGGSVEAIRELQKPTLISTRFRDNSGWMQFLYFINRSLKTNGVVTVTTPNGTTDSFLSLSDGKQSGGSYQSLLTQAANYLVQRLTHGSNYNLDTKASPNPGQTYKGYSKTRNASLQARTGTEISEPFGRIQYRWEGWDISAADTQALVNSLSQKYGFKLYPDGFMQDTTQVQLYALSFSINLYEAALRQILSLSEKQKDAFVSKYEEIYQCNPSGDPAMAQTDRKTCRFLQRFQAGYAVYHPENRGWLTMLLSYLDVSNDMRQFAEFFRSYWKGSANAVAQAEAVLEIFSSLEQFASFEDLIALTGGVDKTGQPINMYVQARLSGFRVGSENISEPISSNTFGHVDPDQSGGPIDAAQQILGVDDGEFSAQWVRDHL